jgi:hypothetical protein
VTQQEVAYYFVALVMGLVNGMNVADRVLVVALNVLLLVVMAVFDSKRLRDRSRRLDVQLKQVYTSDAALVADLERQLGGRVMYHEVTEVDLGRHHTTVDVRYRPGTGVVPSESEDTAAADVVRDEQVDQERVDTAAVDEKVGAGPAEERTTELAAVGAHTSAADRSERAE